MAAANIVGSDDDNSDDSRQELCGRRPVVQVALWRPTVTLSMNSTYYVDGKKV